MKRAIHPDDLITWTLPRLVGLSRAATMPPMHLALTKQAVLRGMTREPWDAAAIESWGQTKAMASADFREGVAAFTERRRPRFTGA
jgi:2-(1,2-epoxy-1,2-dihydrophenyl)acetyl-CoA isomerase